MSQIDVTVVVDAETILKTHPRSLNPRLPTVAFGGSTHLVVDRPNALLGDGSQILVLVAVPGDEIRWQTLSATLASEYSIICYNFGIILGGMCLGQPQLNVATLRLFYPGGSHPLQYVAQELKVPFWSVDVTRPGLVMYSFDFAVLDSAGTVKGYYAWGGSIAIRDD